MTNSDVQLSKFLSLVLRHRPEILGVALDEHGWCGIDELIDKMNQQGRSITRCKLDEIVAADAKDRYSYSTDRTRIRANQGHSISVDLELKQEEPPEFLYHGTVNQYLKSIMSNGLQKKKRQYVHLSNDVKTAEIVGKRRGTPVILRIFAVKMHNDGYSFYQSVNKV